MKDSHAAGGRNVFVGREAQLGLLLGGLEDARAGRGRFLALVGDAGIGKTRTLEEFAARAALPEERILWGRCPEHHGLPAYWPWTQAIGRYLEHCDATALPRVLGRGAADLAQLIPVIGERLGGVEALPAFDPAQARLRLFDSIATLLRRIAESQPLVLVLDDLHWADEGSILLLAFLVPELRRSRALLLGTYRERQMRRLPRLLGEVARAGERVPLAGLELAEVGEFVRHASTDTPLKEALIARLHQVSQGNPFFLDELVRMLKTSGGLAQDEGELGALLPDEVRQVIRRNLEPLAADDRRLLTMAAVLGYEFDVVRLGRLCELPSDDLLERLQLSVAAGVIEEVPGTSGRFRFAHMLIRETVYGDMPPLDRARLHRQVGLALEELHAGSRDVPYATLARHFVHAAVLGDAAKALDYAARAGEQALARLAYEEAAAHLEVALTVLRLERPDEARELELRMSLGHAQTYAGDHHRARATFERVTEQARALGDASSFARAALGFSFAAPGIGAVNPTLVVLLEESLRLLGNEDSALRATVLGCLASALYFSRDAERRDALSNEAVAMARRAGDAGALARALLQRHNVLWGPGSVADRLELCEEIVRLASESGDRPLALHGRLWRLVDLLDAGDIASLDVELESFARESDHSRVPLYRWFAGVVLAARALLDGRLADSERLADEAVTLWQEGPLALPAQTRALQRLMIYLEAGRLAELREAFETMAQKYPAIPGWRSGVAIILAESGRLEDARVLLDEFAARGFADLPRDAHLLPSLASFALIAHLLHDTSCAETLYAALLPYAERNATVGFAAGTFGACARYLGLLAVTMGRLDDAVRHFEHALVANGRLRSRPLLARTQYEYANVLLLRHERARADDLLVQARRSAEQLGLAHLLARIGAAGDIGPGARARTVAATFHREGSHWTISYDGRTVRMKHVKGHDYLALLLQSPGTEIHVLDLAAERPADTPTAGIGLQDLVRRDVGGDAGEMIDLQARAAYRRRLGELEGELEEARRFNDLGGVDRLQDEIDSVTQEVLRATGLGGRARKAGSDAERARINVSRAIASVVKRVSQEHPALGEHLAAKVHTGTFCSYTPDPLVTVQWRF